MRRHRFPSLRPKQKRRLTIQRRRSQALALCPNLFHSLIFLSFQSSTLSRDFRYENQRQRKTDYDYRAHAYLLYTVFVSLLVSLTPPSPQLLSKHLLIIMPPFSLHSPKSSYAAITTAVKHQSTMMHFRRQPDKHEPKNTITWKPPGIVKTPPHIIRKLWQVFSGEISMVVDTPISTEQSPPKYISPDHHPHDSDYQ